MSETLRKLDPDAVVSHTGTMEDRINESVREPYFHTAIVTFFGLGALFLAAIGIYGIVAHESAERTREIGIRVALGANAAHVIRTVLHRGMLPVAAGLLFGSAGAAALAGLLESALFNVHAHELWVFVEAIVVLPVAGLAACWGPAVRSLKVDPAVVLRDE